MHRTSRTFLLAGIAGSLLLHLIVGPFVRMTRSETDVEPPIVRIRIDRTPPTPRPTPTPAPTPTPTPKPAPPHAHVPPAPHVAQRAAVRVARQHAAPAHAAAEAPVAAGSGDAGPSPRTGSPETSGPAASPAAELPLTPAPTSPPACAVANAPAVTLQAHEPETPPLAAQNGVSGDVDVIVSLDERSHVVAAHVLKTASPLLNAAALESARSSVFRTAVRDCAPIAADYVFTVEFSSQ